MNGSWGRAQRSAEEPTSAWSGRAVGLKARCPPMRPLRTSPYALGYGAEMRMHVEGGSRRSWCALAFAVASLLSCSESRSAAEPIALPADQLSPAVPLTRSGSGGAFVESDLGYVAVGPGDRLAVQQPGALLIAPGAHASPVRFETVSIRSAPATSQFALTSGALSREWEGAVERVTVTLWARTATRGLSSSTVSTSMQTGGYGQRRFSALHGAASNDRPR